MDLNSLLGTMVSADSVNSVSRATNVPARDVQSVLAATLPALLNGAMNQSTNQATAQSFAGALTSHSASDTSNVGSFLGNVDAIDGAKIIAHLLGANNTQVVNQASQQTGVSTQNIMKILAIAAPLLMSLLGKQTNAQQQQNASAGVGDLMGMLLKNVNVGSLLMSLLK